jgi:hypothetical protein
MIPNKVLVGTMAPAPPPTTTTTAPKKKKPTTSTTRPTPGTTVPKP